MLYSSCIFFLRLPILSFGDSDLWYHLSGGRYFFSNNVIPNTGFFSFLAEYREWSNYYWLFQVLVYKIYELTGYYGLIILKAVVFVITLLVIAFFLLKDENNESTWSDSLIVSMPKNKNIGIFNPWVIRLIQRFHIMKLLI